MRSIHAWNCWPILMAGAVACGGSGAAADADARDPDAMGDAEVGDLPMPDAPSDTTGDAPLACPSGWTRGEDDRCRPPCPAGWNPVDGVCALPCPADTEAVGPLCRPRETDVGPQPCLADAYDPAGSETSDLTLYVDAALGTPEGDGSRANPFATIAQALDAGAASNAIDLSILLAEGAYVFPILQGGASTVRFLGACAGRVTIESVEIDDPSLAVEIARCRVAGGVNLVRARKLVARDCELASGPVGSSTEAVNLGPYASSVSLVLERNRFVGEDSLISARTGVADAILRANRFDGSPGQAVDIEAETGTSLLEVRGNWFSGDVSFLALGITGSGEALVVNVSGNWFGQTVSKGIDLDGVRGTTTVFDNSFDKRQAREVQGTAIHIGDSRHVLVRQNRVLGTPMNGEMGDAVEIGGASDDLTIEDCLFAGLDGSGVQAGAGVQGVTVRDTFISGGGKPLVLAESADLALAVDGCVLTGGIGQGIYASGGVVRIRRTAIGANGTQGIQARAVRGFEVTDGTTVASNGSTGLELKQMEGEQDAVFEVRDSEFAGNRGIGILVRQGGPHRVLIEDDIVRDTRPGTVANAQGQFQVGDGIAVLTGTDGVASLATLRRNTVSENARLGVLIHGAGTQADVSFTLFGPGNGSGVELGDGGEPWLPQAQVPNLVFQGGAVVGGDDRDLAIPPLVSIPVADSGDPG